MPDKIPERPRKHSQGFLHAKRLTATLRAAWNKTLSELLLEIPLRVRLGTPEPYKSRHLKPPEHFQHSLPLSMARAASFFRSGLPEGLSEVVKEFPARLRAFLSNTS